MHSWSSPGFSTEAMGSATPPDAFKVLLILLFLALLFRRWEDEATKNNEGIEESDSDEAAEGAAQRGSPSTDDMIKHQHIKGEDSSQQK